MQDYQKAFTSPDQGLPEESKQLLVLAYYQKELAQHMYGNLDRRLTSFCADRELNPVFKVCKPAACTVQFVTSRKAGYTSTCKLQAGRWTQQGPALCICNLFKLCCRAARDVSR